MLDHCGQLSQVILGRDLRFDRIKSAIHLLETLVYLLEMFGERFVQVLFGELSHVGMNYDYTGILALG